MKRDRKRIVSVIGITLTLIALAAIPFPGTSVQAGRGEPSAASQQEVKAAPLGATFLTAAESQLDFGGNSEDLDVADVEANPTAPDDTLADDEEVPTDTISATGGPSEIAPAKAFQRKVFNIGPIPLPGGLDHIANGAGTRNTGFGTIRLRGACPGSRPVRAYLYWGTIICGNAIPVFQLARINGVPVVGQLVGFSPQPNWGSTWFTAYRASVIANILPGINGEYRISNLPSSVAHGGDPWRCFAPCPQSEGASLVVLYAAPDVPRNARVFINNGAATFSGAINILNPLARPIPPHRALKHTRLGGDGQVFGSTDALAFASTERTFLGPAGGPFVQIRGVGSAFNVNSDWNGDDGGPLNQLWDTHTDSFGWQFTAYPNILPAGIFLYVVRYTANGDLICPVAHVLGVK
jgi:hypothetical protein